MKVQAGVAKRLGNKSLNGSNGRMGETSSLLTQPPGVGARASGAGDGTVATLTLMTASGRGAAGMSSSPMYSPRSYPRC